MTDSDPLTLVVFDVDGTLIDSQKLIHASMKAAFASHDLADPGLKATRSIIGLSLPEAIYRLAPDLADATNAALVEDYKDAFVTLRAANGGEETAPLFPGVAQMLARLSKRPQTLMGIATGKARRGLDHMFAAHPIGHHFVTLQTADGHPSKPHPSMLHQALSDTGVAAPRAAMVGDTSFDMQMARNAGIAAIGVAWGYHDADAMIAAGAEHIAEDMDDLCDTIDRLTRASV